MSGGEELREEAELGAELKKLEAKAARLEAEAAWLAKILAGGCNNNPNPCWICDKPYLAAECEAMRAEDWRRLAREALAEESVSHETEEEEAEDE